jgi:hypothetical protein
MKYSRNLVNIKFYLLFGLFDNALCRNNKCIIAAARLVIIVHRYSCFILVTFSANKCKILFFVCTKALIEAAP